MGFPGVQVAAQGGVVGIEVDAEAPQCSKDLDEAQGERLVGCEFYEQAPTVLHAGLAHPEQVSSHRDGGQRLDDRTASLGAQQVKAVATSDLSGVVEPPFSFAAKVPDVVIFVHHL